MVLCLNKYIASLSSSCFFMQLFWLQASWLQVPTIPFIQSRADVTLAYTPGASGEAHAAWIIMHCQLFSELIGKSDRHVTVRISNQHDLSLSLSEIVEYKICSSITFCWVSYLRPKKLHRSVWPSHCRGPSRWMALKKGSFTWKRVKENGLFSVKK